MDAVLGWNLVLSLPVILAAACPATPQITGIAVKHGFGPLLGLGQPAGEEMAAACSAPRS
jgi:hypothetical protein